MAAIQMDDDMVCVKSYDGQEFTITKRDLQLSSFLTKQLNEIKAPPYVLICDNDKLQGHLLQLIIEWLIHHQGVAPNFQVKPLRSKYMQDVCDDKWDADFLDKMVPPKSLYGLISASHFLEIESLTNQLCAKLASLIKGQPLELIKPILTSLSTPPA